jgi:hypothetical protein
MRAHQQPEALQRRQQVQEGGEQLVELAPQLRLPVLAAWPARARRCVPRPGARLPAAAAAVAALEGAILLLPRRRVLLQPGAPHQRRHVLIMSACSGTAPATRLSHLLVILTGNKRRCSRNPQ